MASDDRNSFQTGSTGLIVTVAEAERIVGKWRSRFDMSAAAGVPAHITILFPFLDEQLIDGRVKEDLQALMARHQAFRTELRECRRFSSVLYAAPVPDVRFRSLTDEIAERWPQAPPYGGQFDEVIPHLTIADGQDREVFDLVEADVAPHLPIAIRVESVELIVYTGDRWVEEHSFHLGSGD